MIEVNKMRSDMAVIIGLDVNTHEILCKNTYGVEFMINPNYIYENNHNMNERN